jgi:hypothetical protein
VENRAVSWTTVHCLLLQRQFAGNVYVSSLKAFKGSVTEHLGGRPLPPQGSLWLYKSQRKATGEGTRKKQKNRKQRGTKKTRRKETERTNQTKKNTEKRRKSEGATHRGVLVFAIAFVPADKERPRIKTNSQQAGLFIIFLVSKAAEKTKRKRRQVSTEGRKREAVGENPSALQASSVSSRIGKRTFPSCIVSFSLHLLCASEF